ncbi:MAG TPA: poly(R)-hydroxyalkanoic acid synthase subunit PhaE [Chiayiivirga sp.]|nr:poly(R)-hydroxyalkanoic acid synthase subunit PhaE [Chiayiivirga sp.]
MTTATTGQDFGLEAWMRPFREAMTAFQGSAFPGGFPGALPGSFPGAFPGMGGAAPFSNMAGWFGGQAAPTMPGWPQGAGAGPAAGAFTRFLQQLSELAQAQWQQLALQAGTGIDSESGALANWRALVESVAAKLASAAGPFELGPLPALDTSALREALSTPAVGPMREHIERWQGAMLAQLDYQEAAREFSAQLGETMRLAQAHLRERLAERAAKNEPLTTSRALFDEWVEAGEQAWAERAGSDAFVAALGRFTNAEMKVRAAKADQINRLAESLGLPTRGEVDADHRRIAQLERELRRLRSEVASLRDAAAAAPAVQPEAAPRTAVKKPQAQARPAATPAPDVAAKAPAAKTPRARVKAARSSPARAPAKASSNAPMKPPPAAARRSKASVSMLPLVDAPRALGTRGRKVDEAAQRRRAGK